jgi:DNA-binding NtrC family response regulator
MPKRILIVDDEPVQRRLLEAAVTRMGFEPVVAAGGYCA